MLTITARSKTENKPDSVALSAVHHHPEGSGSVLASIVLVVTARAAAIQQAPWRASVRRLHRVRDIALLVPEK